MATQRTNEGCTRVGHFRGGAEGTKNELLKNLEQFCPGSPSTGLLAWISSQAYLSLRVPSSFLQSDFFGSSCGQGTFHILVWHEECVLQNSVVLCWLTQEAQQGKMSMDMLC